MRKFAFAVAMMLAGTASAWSAQQAIYGVSPFDSDSLLTIERGHGYPTTASVPPLLLAEASGHEDANLELDFWKQIKDSDNPEDFRRYLNRYPAGVFVYLAEKRLRKLEEGRSGDSAGSAKIGSDPGLGRLEALLQRAEEDEAAFRLTSPQGNNAYQRYLEVMRIDPGNERAVEGVVRIRKRYLAWFERAMDQGNLKKAKTNLDKAAKIKPEDPGMAERRQRLAEAEKKQLHESAPVEAIVSVDSPTSSPASAEQQALPELSLETIREPETGMEFVRIPGECFVMGSPEDERGRFKEEQPHLSCVTDFIMARHEVTNAQFRRFKPSHDSREFEGLSLNGDDQPAAYVSWASAFDYANWLSKKTGKRFRLPTEVEWEYAARAGAKTARFWGSDPSKGCGYANIQDNAASNTFKWKWNKHRCDDGYAVSSPVGSFTANRFGLYDMIGNVYEWTCSAWDKTYSGSELLCVDEKWAPSNRVLRGGSWASVPRNARAAFRMNRPPSVRTYDFGFRLVMEE